jgi:hypothetical protein
MIGHAVTNCLNSGVIECFKIMKNKLTAILFGAFLLAGANVFAQSPWTPEQAHEWYGKRPPLVGCNFTPSTAINQLEMWQADTFDPVTIDRELGWAEQIGFTSVRVFLHNLLWQQDSKGFLKRMDRFLEIAHQHHIGAVFVLFDSCWDPNPTLGKQREPRPFVHNSGWVQSPGIEMLAHPERFEELKPYVEGVVGHFRNDPRVDFWDVFNEPDNGNDTAYGKIELTGKNEMTLILLQEAFAWAREAKPSQPLSSGVWRGDWAQPEKLSPTERVQLQNSDVITFHNYGPLAGLEKCVEHLRRYQRPIICTEYMARPVGSRFDPNLKYMCDQHVGAYNWGFVSGKTQTIYPWDSWSKTYTAEPPVWFHDIFRADGTPYDPKEVSYIKSVTLK